MEIGVKFQGRDDGCRYLGYTKWMNEGRDAVYFRADVKLSPEIQRALELTKPLWIKNSPVPLAYVDSGNHGYGIGLVFNAGECEGILNGDMRDFVRRELVARVSVGGSRKKKDGTAEDKSELESEVDFSNPSRIHISVLGRRQFFPKEWRDLPYEDDGWGRKADKRLITPVVEEVHVSMRWLDGQFNNWNDMEEWYKDFGSHSFESKEFSKMRTTYCVAYTEKISQKQNSEREQPEEVKKLIKSEGRKRQVIPLSPEINQFKDKYTHANKALATIFNGGIESRIPIIGFQEVRYATGFDDVDGMYDNQIAKMTPQEGVEYLFGKVMPAVEMFTKK